MPKPYRRVIEAVYGRPWAILPSKMEEIAEFLQMKAEGIQLSKNYVFNRFEAEVNDELVTYAGIHGASTTANELDASTKRIAVMNMFGTISQRMNFMAEFSGGTSTELFGKAFNEAINDNSIIGIIINADSPGGSVPGVPELSEKIHNASKENIKPVYTLVNPMMASAAYWIGTASQKVYAIPSSEVIGSIGVLSIHTDISESEAKLGKKYTVFRTVENKAETLDIEPLKKSTIAHIKSITNEIHEEFVDAVARNMGISTTKVNNDFGSGRYYRSKEALKRGMIHGIATLDEVVNLISEDHNNRSSLFVASASGSTSTQLEASVVNPSLVLPEIVNDIQEGTTVANATLEDATSNIVSSEVIKSDIKVTKQVSTKEIKVNPKIKLFLMKEGLCKATDSAEVFTSALETWYAAQDKLVPSDESKILEDISPNTNVSTETVTVSATSNISITDMQNTVRISNLSAEDKLNLITDLTGRINANDPKDVIDVSRVVDSISNTESTSNEIAGQGATVIADATDKFKAAAVESICKAAWGTNIPQQVYDFEKDDYKDFKIEHRGTGVNLAKPIMLGRQLLAHFGVPANICIGMDKTRVAKLMVGAMTPESAGLRQYMSDGPAYNVSGMFSNILLDATNVLLRRSYDDGRQTFKIWMKQAESAEDFKVQNLVIAGALEDPTAIPEDGEFQESSLTDGKETYKLVNWGRVFSHSWQVMVNDKLSSFTEIPTKQGTAMVRKQNRLAYSVLKDNAALQQDSVALFDGTTATHKNNHSDTASTADAMRTLFSKLDRTMREQVGIGDDAGTLNIPPKYVIYPPEQDDLVRTVLNSTSTDTTNPAIKNIRQGEYTPINEAELGVAADSVNGNDDIIYMAADSNDIDTIVYAYLAGHESPVLEQATAFDRLAIRQRIYQPFAVKAVDYRGLQRNDTA